MGIVVRQSVKNTIYSYLGVALGFLNVIWLYPHILEPSQFGLTKLLTSLAALVSQFGLLGMGQITLKYFPYFRDEKRHHRGFLFFALIISTIGFLLLCILFFLFKGTVVNAYQAKSPLFTQYYYYLLPLIGFTLFFTFFDFYSRALYRTVFPSFVSDVLLRFLNTLIILIFWMHWVGFHTFVLLYIGCTAIQMLLMVIYLASSGHFHLKPDFSFFRRYLVKEIIKYGLFSILAGMAYIAINNIDIIMLGALTGLASTAVYYVAFSVGTLIEIPGRAIRRITFPLIHNAWKQEDRSYVSGLYKKTSMNQFLPGVLIFIMIWASVNNLIAFLPHEYASGKYVILFIGFARLFDMITGANGGILQASEHYRYSLYSNVFLLVLAVVTNLIFIPMYGVVGAAMATAISIFLGNSASLLVLWYFYDMQPFTRNTVYSILLAAGVLAFSYLLPFVHDIYIDTIVRSIVIASVFLSLSYRWNLSEDVNQLIDKSLKRIHLIH